MKISIIKNRFTIGAKTSKNVSTRDATNNLFFAFRFIGIDMPTKFSPTYIVYSAVINALGIIYMPIAFTNSVISQSNHTKISNRLTTLQTGINNYGCVVKVTIMAFLLKKLRKAEIYMDKLDARCVAKDEKDEICKAVKFSNRIVAIFAIIYHIYITSTFLAAVLSGRPPYAFYNPFGNWRDSTKSFVISVVTEYIVINITCMQEVAGDSYPVVYISILRRHINILLLRISKLGSDSTKSKEENTQELMNCIIDHKNIIELLDIVHAVISKTIFVQFVITAAILGTTLINVLIFADLSASIASLCYILAVVIQILPCCYYAECLIVENDRISNAIFHSNWIEQDFKFRKMLVFFIQNSQKQMTMTAGKIFPINLDSFIGIAKFSFSLYTFIRQMQYDGEGTHTQD